MNKRFVLFASVWWAIMLVTASVALYEANVSAPKDKTPDADSILWQTPLEHPVRDYTTADGKVFLTDKEGNVYGYDAETGNLLWKYTVGNERHSLIHEFNGKLYVSSFQDVMRLSENTGHVEMDYLISSADNEYNFDEVTSFSVEAQKLVCEYSDRGRVVYDLASGQPLWSTHPHWGYQVYETNTSIPDSKLPFLESDDLNIKAIDLDNGNTIWSYPGSGGQLVTEDRVIIVNYAAVQATQSYLPGQSPKEHAIVCLNRATGQKLWSTETAQGIFAVKIYDNLLLYMSFDGSYYAVNMADGSTKWKTHLADLSGNNYPFNSTELSIKPALTMIPTIDKANNRLVWCIGTRDKTESNFNAYLWSLNLRDGAQSWSRSINSTWVEPIGSQTNMVQLNNRLYLNDENITVCLDSVSGEVLWARNYTQQACNPLLVEDKVVVAIDNTLVAYKP